MEKLSQIVNKIFNEHRNKTLTTVASVALFLIYKKYRAKKLKKLSVDQIYNTKECDIFESFLEEKKA